MSGDIGLTVNRRPVKATVEPRLHLADFLRGQLGLTGTHLGCEQGVCGACTILIDGKPARSCITFAVACDGADIVTIEGFDDEELMADLREAFSAHHGLQCGFCTPGMLIAARDLILRRGECDEAAIREELSGNLCRCTGYMGIVAAVKAASQGRKPRPAAMTAATVAATATAGPVPAAPAAAARPAPEMAAAATGTDGWTELSQRVAVTADADATWKLLHDIPRVARCLPGAELQSYEDGVIRGRMIVRFGPIKASFAGDGAVSFDEAARAGLLRGAGRDTGSGSQANGEVVYTVRGVSPAACEIDITLRYRVTGMLAQFSRGSLVRDLVARLTDSFAQNLAASLAAPDRDVAVKDLGGFGLIGSVLAGRLRGMFKRPSP